MERKRKKISMLKPLLGLVLVAGAFGAGIYGARMAASRMDPFFNDQETELMIDDEPLYVDEIPDPTDSDEQQAADSSGQMGTEAQSADEQEAGAAPSGEGSAEVTAEPTDSPLDPYETEIIP